MSLTISGGGGGGITIETDPTALKKASNLADLTNNEDARNNLINLGLLADAPIDGTTYGRQSGMWVAAGGGSFTGGTVTTAVVADAGIGAGQAILDPSFEGTARLYVGNSDGGQQTVIYPTSISFSNYGTSLSINESNITFPDGTQQTTAYTGGGGGGVANQQRLADAIAALVATPVVSYGTFGVTINLQWAFTSAYNNNSLYYEYPKFIDSMNGYGYPNTYSYTPYAYAANEYFGMSYVDSNGMVFISLNNISQYEPFTDAVTIVVTDNVNGGGYLDNTTTAYSFPCAIASYYPV